MQFEVTPNEAVGKVFFGADREEVRCVLNGFKGEFKKSKFSKNTTDDFGYCHVFYNRNNQCNAVEFFEKCELIYMGKDLFKISALELKKLFPDIKEEYGSYISVLASVGVVFNGDTVESVLIGCKDYYC
jgi:hypothetical protein